MKRTFTFLVLITLIASFNIKAQQQDITFDPVGKDNYFWQVFSNAASDDDPQSGAGFFVVDNPSSNEINNSSTVGKFESHIGAYIWAGVKDTTANFDESHVYAVSDSSKILTIDVFKENITDVAVKIKLEGPLQGSSVGDVDGSPTKAAEWEKLTYDFSAWVGDTFKYLVIMPDFVSGDRASGNFRIDAATTYFDNIRWYANEDAVTSIKNSVAENFDVRLYPNPASDYIEVIGANIVSINVLNVVGQSVFKSSQVQGVNRLNVSGFNEGIYFVSVRSKTGTKKIFKVIVK